MMQPRNGILPPIHSVHLQRFRFAPINNNNNYSNSNNNYLSEVPPFGSNQNTPSLIQTQPSPQQQPYGSVTAPGSVVTAPVENGMFPSGGEEHQFPIDDMNDDGYVGTNSNASYGTAGATLCNSIEPTETLDMFDIDEDGEAYVVQNNPLTSRTNAVSNVCEHQGSTASTDSSRKCSSNIVWKDMASKPHTYFQTGSSTVATPAFTFTTPTQSSLSSPAVMGSSFTRATPHTFTPSSVVMGANFARATPHTFTPTACTPWQHAVPQRLAWTQGGLARMQGVSIFTGSMSSPSHSVNCSQTSGFPLCSSQTSPIPPSSSRPPRRPKRHSSENLDYLSPTNKIRLTDEKIAQHMQELRIHNQSVSNSSTIPTDTISPRRSTERCPALPGSPWVGANHSAGHCRNTALPGSPWVGANHSAGHCRNTALPGSPWVGENKSTGRCRNTRHSHMTTDDQWQNYKALEEKLSVSDDESDGEKDETTMSKQPSLRIVENIDRLIPSQATIPQDIMEKIQRPRMEVVLWTPPEGTVQKLINGSFSDSKTDKSSLVAVDTELSTIVEDDNGMEMDLAEDMFEL